VRSTGDTFTVDAGGIDHIMSAWMDDVVELSRAGASSLPLATGSVDGR
jgi:hypothetical protein